MLSQKHIPMSPFTAQRLIDALTLIAIFFPVLAMQATEFSAQNKFESYIKRVSQTKIVIPFYCCIQISFSKNIKPVSTTRNAKLKSENFAMYFPALPGLCFMYSRKVIRLARDAINVPTPPMFTPTSKSA